jgi:dGTPase
MAAHGGFEHNLQSLRVVDHLERRYPAFNGLNLCFETREGILKHCSRRNAEALALQDSSGVAARFCTGGQPSMEAQLCNLADELTYCAHDLDDGVRSGLLPLDALDEEPTLREIAERMRAEFSQEALSERVWLYTLLRRLLSESVADLVAATQARVLDSGVKSIEDVRAAPALVGFSPNRAEALGQIKRFLFARLYRHPQVEAQRQLAQTVLRELFEHYAAYGVPEPTDPDPARACADYLAGMTDRFAIREHQRLTGRKIFPQD